MPKSSVVIKKVSNTVKKPVKIQKKTKGKKAIEKEESDAEEAEQSETEEAEEAGEDEAEETEEGEEGEETEAEETEAEEDEAEEDEVKEVEKPKKNLKNKKLPPITKEKKLKSQDINVAETKVAETKVVDDYKAFDLKFINKHKPIITKMIVHFVKKNFKSMKRQTDKAIIDNKIVNAQIKDQIMYILFAFINTISSLPEPEDGIQSDEISAWVGKTLNTESVNYMVHRYLKGVTHRMKYNLLGEDIENDLLDIVSQLIVNTDDVKQYLVETFLLFLKKIAFFIANNYWKSTRHMTSIQFNTVLRNANENNTNYKLFDLTYGFSEHQKNLNKKVKD